MVLSIFILFGCDITNKTEVTTSNINIEVVRPISWEEFSTNELQVNLLVVSDQEITKIDLYVDGNLMQTLTEAPFEEIITISDIGTHNFYAIATDNLESSKNSELVNFSIAMPDNEIPSGFIAYPADWSDVVGSFDVFISAEDNIAISQVELYLDGDLYNTTEIYPYQFNIDSTVSTSDNHTIYGKIFDTSNNVNTTQLITFRVNN